MPASTMQEMMDKARRELKEKLATGTPIIPAVKYQCDTCRDDGLVRSDAEWGEPEWGKLVTCPACHGRDYAAFKARSGLLPSDYGLDWNALKTLAGHNIHEGQRAVSDTLKRKHGWVYLHGDYGLGKTLLLRIAVARANAKGIYAIYTSTSEMMDHLRTAFDVQDPQVESMRRLREFQEVPVLAVDEFEKVNRTPFVEEKLFRLMDLRYELATREQRGVTLLASNLPPAQMSDRALRDRILDQRFHVVELTGGSVRPVAKEIYPHDY